MGPVADDFYTVVSAILWMYGICSLCLRLRRLLSDVAIAPCIATVLTEVAMCEDGKMMPRAAMVWSEPRPDLSTPSPIQFPTQFYRLYYTVARKSRHLLYAVGNHRVAGGMCILRMIYVSDTDT